MTIRAILIVMVALICVGPGCMVSARSDLQGQGRLQDQGDGTCLDLATGRLWQTAKSKRVNSLTEANHYVDQLSLAGQSDWRLPTLAELYELFLLLDRPSHGDCKMDFAGNYWSVDADKEGRVGAWELDGTCQPERQYVPKQSGYVRAVRP